MTKNLLIIIRHAKSSWDNPGQKDFDRPLNDRGIRNAPFMGEWLSNWLTQNTKDETIDILCSSSIRTTQTLELMKSGFTPSILNRVSSEEYTATLYHADSYTLIEQAKKLSSPIKILISHNPGINALVCAKSKWQIENVPTNGICILKFKGNWEMAKIVEYVYPKGLRKS